MFVAYYTVEGYGAGTGLVELDVFACCAAELLPVDGEFGGSLVDGGVDAAATCCAGLADAALPCCDLPACGGCMYGGGHA